MEPISRRQALVLGALGTGGAVVGTLGLTRTGALWGTGPGSPVDSGPGAVGRTARTSSSLRDS